MIEKMIGKENNGIEIKLYESGNLAIWELMEERRRETVNLNSEEALELKKFLDENLKEKKKSEIDIGKLMVILNPFTEYCKDVRSDWSEFDGRSLLNVWNQVLKEIEEINES